MNSNQQLTKLSTLPVNKTVVFYSPIEGKDVLVRTGVISEGGCFMHSLMHAYSKDYVKMEKKDRLKLVDKLKNNMSEKLLKRKWENASNGLVAKLPFQENVQAILTDFYRYIVKKRSCKTKGGESVLDDIIKNDSDKETYAIICELVPFESLEKEVLVKSYDKCADQNMEKSKTVILKVCENHIEKILKDMGESLDNSKKKYCLKKFVSLIESVLKEADSISYKSFVKNSKEVSIDVDSNTIELISERLNRDIYFVDSRTRIPYLISNTSVKKRKSIIIMWLGGVHYEVVGKLLPGNRIQREFDYDDPLIKRIYTFLYRPESIASQYPNLVPYLTGDQKNNLGIESRSNSSSGSDSDFDSETNSESDSEKSQSESASKSKSRSAKTKVRSKVQMKSKSGSPSKSKSGSPSGSSSKSKSGSPSKSRSGSMKTPVSKKPLRYRN